MSTDDRGASRAELAMLIAFQDRVLGDLLSEAGLFARYVRYGEESPDGSPPPRLLVHEWAARHLFGGADGAEEGSGADLDRLGDSCLDAFSAGCAPPAAAEAPRAARPAARYLAALAALRRPGGLQALLEAVGERKDRSGAEPLADVLALAVEMLEERGERERAEGVLAELAAADAMPALGACLRFTTVGAEFEEPYIAAEAAALGAAIASLPFSPELFRRLDTLALVAQGVGEKAVTGLEPLAEALRRHPKYFRAAVRGDEGRGFLIGTAVGGLPDPVLQRLAVDALRERWFFEMWVALAEEDDEDPDEQREALLPALAVAALRSPEVAGWLAAEPASMAPRPGLRRRLRLHRLLRWAGIPRRSLYARALEETARSAGDRREIPEVRALSALAGGAPAVYLRALCVLGGCLAVLFGTGLALEELGGLGRLIDALAQGRTGRTELLMLGALLLILPLTWIGGRVAGLLTLLPLQVRWAVRPVLNPGALSGGDADLHLVQTAEGIGAFKPGRGRFTLRGAHRLRELLLEAAVYRDGDPENAYAMVALAKAFGWRPVSGADDAVSALVARRSG
ncbi:hypothetical protein [Nocardiopsis potens]|uniref:hypothetical protein n=1 Tax=Nocardiopsis potens TaxID=1246458 RepID=UPI0003455DD7|nr:hypothetical protein [Nocardiopsis potens]